MDDRLSDTILVQNRFVDSWAGDQMRLTLIQADTTSWIGHIVTD